MAVDSYAYFGAYRRVTDLPLPWFRPLIVTWSGCGEIVYKLFTYKGFIACWLFCLDDHAWRSMFQEGPEVFEGGMSAGKYSSITGASPATATRDLADLTEKGGLIREGERRHARHK